MNLNKIFACFILLCGSIVFAGWMIVDIYGSYKLNPAFAAIGAIFMSMGVNELNYIEIIEKLNESKKPT